PKKPWELPPEKLLNTLRMDEEYIWEHFLDHYTHYPSIFSWIPFRSFKLYLKASLYDTQVKSILNVWVLTSWNESYRKQLSDYRTEFHNTVDVASYNDTKELWEDYASGLMNEIPSYEEVKKEFDDIPEKLHGATNEKRLMGFYKREMEMLKANYENKRPERIMYDTEVLRTLETLAENNGDTSSESFEDWEIPYGEYFVKVGLIALLQTLFVFVGYWKVRERK
ncbi:MAG: hypothetical protein U9N35_01155, partial [Euryarchaeota archaeon]|nr:hypothetical protein [Euryarchaeota archaeon]